MGLGKLVRNLALGTALAVGSSGLYSCKGPLGKGLGAVAATSNDPLTRALGIMVYHGSDYEQKREIAREGRTQVNVGGGSQRGNGSQEGYYWNYGNNNIFFYSCNSWRDINRNDIIEKEEIFGLGKKYFDLNKETFSILFSSSYEGPIRVDVFTQGGELVAEQVFMGKKNNYSIDKCTGQGCSDVGYWVIPPEKRDFMDKIEEHGTGTYIITATLENLKKTYRLEVTVKYDDPYKNKNKENTQQQKLNTKTH